MTRIEIYRTLDQLGYDTKGMANNSILVQPRKGARLLKKSRKMTEPEAVEFIRKHEKTHCLSCGRPYRKQP